MLKQHSIITEEAYLEAYESNQGWCTFCCEFTRDFCEPDAERYECPQCGKKRCYGAEQALLLQLVTF